MNTKIHSLGLQVMTWRQTIQHAVQKVASGIWIIEHAALEVASGTWTLQPAALEAASETRAICHIALEAVSGGWTMQQPNLEAEIRHENHHIHWKWHQWHQHCNEWHQGPVLHPLLFGIRSINNMAYSPGYNTQSRKWHLGHEHVSCSNKGHEKYNTYSVPLEAASGA